MNEYTPSPDHQQRLSIGRCIPDVLHLTSARVPLRGVERRLMRQNARALGGWEIRVWSDEENDELMAAHFPEVLKTYRALPYGVMKADMARLAYMHAVGGWYADTDYKWFRKPEYDCHKYAAIMPYSRSVKEVSGPRLGNAIFGSVAGHPVWRFVIEATLKTPFPGNLPKAQIEKATGPEGLTEYLREISRYDDVWLAPRALFHPSDIRNPDPKAVRPVGVHLTRGSWRSDHRTWRAKMALRQIRDNLAKTR